MKKVLSCLLAVLILASFTVSAFAAASPQNQPAPQPAPVYVAPEKEPEPAAVDANGEDISSLIVITPVTDKDSLSEELLADFEAGVASAEELDVAALVDGEGREVGIAQVFYISSTEEVVFPVTLRLQLENPDAFAALIHLVDDEWVVEETELKDDILKVTVESLGTFAIVEYLA